MAHKERAIMPLVIISLFAVMISMLPSAWLAAQPADSTFGVFEGITACSGTDRALPQIPVDAECEMMIWELTLYQDPDTAEPTTYELHTTYGMSQPNTTGIRGGGIPIDLEGRWRITEGIAVDSSATVYELNPDTPDSAVYLVKLNDNILHILSAEKELMLGNAAWSYTLNRTDTLIEAAPASLDTTPAQPLDETSTADVFEGRTPCADEIVEFTEFPVSPDCIKIKMRVTLYRDPQTGEPTTYHVMGTGTTRDGTWTEIFGTPAHPNSVIYHLSLETPERFVSFLRADDNHLFALDDNMQLLVGDKLWSFTLTRDLIRSAEMAG